MALAAATPDKGRVQRKVRGARVEGRYLETTTWGIPFRCRYRPQSQSESRDQGGVRRVRPAQLTILARDTTGAKVDVKASDRVEVTTKSGEVFLFEVMGAPDPIRKKSTVIGWTATLSKVDRSRDAA